MQLTGSYWNAYIPSGFSEYLFRRKIDGIMRADIWYNCIFLQFVSSQRSFQMTSRDCLIHILFTGIAWISNIIFMSCSTSLHIQMKNNPFLYDISPHSYQCVLPWGVGSMNQSSSSPITCCPIRQEAWRRYRYSLAMIKRQTLKSVLPVVSHHNRWQSQLQLLESNHLILKLVCGAKSLPLSKELLSGSRKVREGWCPAHGSDCFKRNFCNSLAIGNYVILSNIGNYLWSSA